LGCLGGELAWAFSLGGGALVSLRERSYPEINSEQSAKQAIRRAWGSWLPLVGYCWLSLIFLSENDTRWIGALLIGGVLLLAAVQFYFRWRFKRWAALTSFVVMMLFLARSIQMTISNGFAETSPVGFVAIQLFLLIALLTIWNGYRGTRFLAAGGSC